MNLGTVLFLSVVFFILAVFLILAAASLLFKGREYRESKGFGLILLGPVPIILRGNIALVIIAAVAAMLLLLLVML